MNVNVNMGATAPINPKNNEAIDDMASDELAQFMM